MKFFIINFDYKEAIEGQYKKEKELKNKSFIEQLEQRYKTLFGLSNFYSKNLKKLGHEAIDIIANHKYIQKKWAEENDFRINVFSDFFSRTPILKKIFKRNWIQKILEAQINWYKPDVIYNMAMESIDSSFLNQIKNKDKIFVVGQHAAPFNDNMNDLSAYDLIFSSLPNFVEFFRSKGKISEYLKLGFESTILDNLPNNNAKKYDVVYIGGYGSIHSERNKTLEFIADQDDFKVDFWGYGSENLSDNSSILKNFHGFIGGIDMYKILQSSKICLNGHLDISGDYANNMRLYESTGVGVLLITDKKKNLNEIFEIDKEVITYENKEDLKEKISTLLKNQTLLSEISKNGQNRTLKEHNYLERMKEMVALLEHHMMKK